MGADGFEYLNAPQMFTFEFIIDTVTIFEGEHQNIEPENRFILVDEDSNILYTVKDGKKKRTNKIKKGKKKKAGKHKSNIEIKPTEAIFPTVKRKKLFLPPFRIDIRFFFDREISVNQIDLPCEELKTKLQTYEYSNLNAPKESDQPEESNQTINLALDKAKKKPKSKKKQKPKKKVKKNEKIKAPVVQEKENSMPWITEDQYSNEELSWCLPSEQAFRRGTCVTFTASAQQMILWLQRGPFHIELSRWKGYGEKIPIGTAKFNIDSDSFIQMALSRSRTMTFDTMTNRAEEIVDIFDQNKEKIGEINIVFFMLCSGGTMISKCLVSEKGLYDFLTAVETDNKDVEYETSEKFLYSYDFEVMKDFSFALVPNAMVYDNSPFIKCDKYNEYEGDLYKILLSNNPVIAFGQHIEKVTESHISSEDAIV